MDFSTILLVFFPILLGIIYYFHQKYTYWSRLGVKSPPSVPIFGNIWEPLLKGMVRCELEWVQKYGKVYGTYSGLEPSLTSADPELIKQILVKDFHHFVNRDNNHFDHEIWARNLFNLENDDWKRVRSITSPSFTSGKLKAMHLLMGKCIEKLDDFYGQVCSEKSNNEGTIDTKKVMSGFTIDVIAFATDTNANDDRASENVFVCHGTNLLNFRVIRIIGMLLTPKFLRKTFNYDIVFEPKSFQFFCDLAKQIIKERKENIKLKRNDLVQLLIDSYVTESELSRSDYATLTASADKDNSSSNIEEKQHKIKNIKTLDDIEIIAQCIVFFIAGFETTASTLTQCLYELAMNPPIQQKLYDQISDKLNALDNQSNEYYEIVIGQIPLLEAVIKETLRLYPPLARLSRRAGVENYRLAGIPLYKGQEVEIATFAVHQNPEYYPLPEQFNPSRFMPENKHLLVPYTYLPFGAGPRNCVGMRFAYQEIKLYLAHILFKYKFEFTPDTPTTRQYKRIGVLGRQNFPLKVVKRQ